MFTFFSKAILRDYRPDHLPRVYWEEENPENTRRASKWDQKKTYHITISFLTKNRTTMYIIWYVMVYTIVSSSLSVNIDTYMNYMICFSKYFRICILRIIDIFTRWAPTRYKWSYNLYKWPYKWVTRVIALHIQVINPVITGRDENWIISPVINWIISSVINSVIIGSFPQVGVKINNIWNHHPEIYLLTVLPFPGVARYHGSAPPGSMPLAASHEECMPASWWALVVTSL